MLFFEKLNLRTMREEKGHPMIRSNKTNLNSENRTRSVVQSYSLTIRLSPFFSSFTVEWVCWYWVGRSDWKKKNLKKKSRNSRPWYPRTTLKVNIYIFGLTKWSIYYEKYMFMFLFLFFSMLLLCSFFRLKELFQVKNGVTTSLLFFFENAKNLGRSDDGKRRKKTGWPHCKENTITIYFRQCTPMR